MFAEYSEDQNANYHTSDLTSTSIAVKELVFDANFQSSTFYLIHLLTADKNICLKPFHHSFLLLCDPIIERYTLFL